MPLQALARRDPTVARNLFSSIFNALYKQVPKNSAEQMKPELRKQFDNVFRNTRHNTPFIGCLLKVSYKLMKLRKWRELEGK
jgi:DNA-PKcs, CC5